MCEVQLEEEEEGETLGLFYSETWLSWKGSSGWDSDWESYFSWSLGGEGKSSIEAFRRF